MKRGLTALRALHRSIPWQSKPHRFFWWFCSVCLSLYLAYATYLSCSGLFLSGVDTAAALLWFAAIVCAAFALLRWGSVLQGVILTPDERARLNPGMFAIATAISLAILGVYLMASFPGGVSVDSAVQWTQASTGVYSNWHPVFHTLLLRLGWLVKPQYAFVVALQCGAFSLALGYLIATLHAWGIKTLPLLAVEFLAVGSPILGHTMMYLWKDNAMTIGVTLLFAQTVNLYFSRGKWISSLVNGFAFGATLAFTTLVRHNALLFTLPLLMATLLCYPKKGLGVLMAVATLVTTLALVWGPLYSTLKVTYPHNGLEESIGVPMTVISNIRKLNPDVLDAETRTFTDAMADDAGWDKYVLGEYNSIKFGNTRQVVARSTLSQILRMTANVAIADPRNAFQAVNSVTDLVWGLGDEGNANVMVRNSGDLPSVPKQNGSINKVGNALKAFIAAPQNINGIAWYFGNLGVSFLLMLGFALRSMRRNGVRVLVLCLPVLLYNLGTMCVLCGADARFFSYSPLLCTMSLFVLSRDLTPETQSVAEKETA